MIDRLIIKGAVGTPQPHHQTCLSQVTYTRFLQSKAKTTTTFINSPITGAQIDVQYWIDSIAGRPTAFVQISIPLASATMGHNYIHAGLDSLNCEVICGALLVKITLTVLGFTADEIVQFMRTSEPQLVEVTWHRNTASARARLNLQKRTKSFFDAQLLLSGRHDIAVCDVDYQEGNGKPGLLVSFKSGDQYRQYGKFDQVKSRAKKGRNKARMSDAIRESVRDIVQKLETQVRNELLFGPETLKRSDLGHPSLWTAEKFLALINRTWTYIGFPPKGTSSIASEPESKLSPQAENTWQRYLAGEDVQKALPPHTFTRHRASIKKRWGKDIADKPKGRGARPESIGHQLGYGQHCEPTETERRLVLCQETAPPIIQELRSGLGFLETGELPTFDSESTRDAWLLRWKFFTERERGQRIKSTERPASRNVSFPINPPTPSQEK